MTSKLRSLYGLYLGMTFLFNVGSVWAANVVTTGGSGTGPGTFPYEFNAADTTPGGGTVTFSSGAYGQTCSLGGPISMTNTSPSGDTINSSTLSSSANSFTLQGRSGQVVPDGIQYSGSGTAALNLIGNGYLKFDRSGFVNLGPGTFNVSVPAGHAPNLSFLVIGGFINQGGIYNLAIHGGTYEFTLAGNFANGGTGTMNIDIDGGTFVLPYLSGFINNSTGPMNFNISGGNFLFTGGSGFGTQGSGLMTVNISGGTLTSDNNLYPDFINLSTGAMDVNISGGLYSLTNGRGFVNPNGGTMNVSITGGTIAMDNTGAACNVLLPFTGNSTFVTGVNGVLFGETAPNSIFFPASFSFTNTVTHRAAIGTATGGGTSKPVLMSTLLGTTPTSTATLGGATLDVVSTSSPSALAGKSYVIVATDTTAGTAPSVIQGTYGKLTSTASTPLMYSVAYAYHGQPMTVTVNVNANQSWAAYVGNGAPSNVVAFATYLNECGNLGNDSAFIALNNYRLAGDTIGYDNALNKIQNAQVSATGTGAFNNGTALTGTTGGQVQTWLTNGAAPISGNEASAGFVSSSLASIAPTRLAAFGKLVTHQTLNSGSISSLLEATPSMPKRKGVLEHVGSLSSGLTRGFTNSPEQVNRHVQAGRVQVGKANVWVQPYGQLTRQNGDNKGNPSVRTQTGGIVLGADYEVTPNTLVGVLGGTSATPFTWGSNRGNGQMNSGFGGLYGAWKEGSGFYVEGQTIFGGNSFTTNRTISFSTINRVANESHNAFQLTGNLEVGYALPVYDWFTCQPFMLGDYMVMNEAGYTENGAGSLNMVVNSRTSQFFQGEVGAMVYQTFAWGETLLRPTAELGWMIRTPMGAAANVNGGLISQPSTLVVTGVNKVYNQIAPGVGLIAQFKNGLYVSTNVYAECGGGLNIGEALVRVGYEF